MLALTACAPAEPSSVPAPPPTSGIPPSTISPAPTVPPTTPPITEASPVTTPQPDPVAPLPAAPIESAGWRRVAATDPGTILTHLAASPDGRMVAAGFAPKVPGHSPQRSVLAVWDGQTFTTHDVHAIFGVDVPHLVDVSGVVWADGEWLVGTIGAAPHGEPVVLRTASPETWEVESLTVLQAAAFDGMAAMRSLFTPDLIQHAVDVGITDLAATRGGVLATGWRVTDSAASPIVWRATGSNEWEERELPHDPHTIAQRIVAGSGLLVVGTNQIGGIGEPRLWYSIDATSWSALDTPPASDLMAVWLAAPGAQGIMAQTYGYDSDFDGPGDWWMWTAGWRAIAPPGPGTIRALQAAPDGFLAGGCAPDGTAALWHTTDGARWTMTSLVAPGCVEGIEPAEAGPWHLIVRNDDRSVVWAGDPGRWDTADFVGMDGTRRDVVLVEHDDHLNVRRGPGIEHAVIGRLAPTARGVTITGSASGPWLEVALPDETTGWAHGFYLATPIDPGDWSEEDLFALLDGFAGAIDTRRDLTSYVSAKGLHVVYWNEPRRITDLSTVMTDPTTYQWGSNAADPQDWPHWTFARAIGDSLTGVWMDPDREVRVGAHIEGPNGMPAAFAVPTPFANLLLVSAHDPGDDAAYGGIDWMTWDVFLTVESGELRIAGMSIDAWAP